VHQHVLDVTIPGSLAFQVAVTAQAHVHAVMYRRPQRAAERVLDAAAGDAAELADECRLGLQARLLPVRERFPLGEEVVEAPAVPGPWQIFDSGSPGLEAMLRTWGAETRRVTGVRDRREAVRDAIAGAGGDLVVTLGGASVGDHDLVRSAAADLGLDMRVESVAVRPGKPTFFGVLGDGRPLLGLPGNPASAFVCAELFLRPLVAALEGRPSAPVLRMARLVGTLPANGPREHWMRARLASGSGGDAVEPFLDQDSSLVRVFSEADALLRRLPGAPAAAVGEHVEVLALLRG
jgi:molybdopterin molybdotransferase